MLTSLINEFDRTAVFLLSDTKDTLLQYVHLVPGGSIARQTIHSRGDPHAGTSVTDFFASIGGCSTESCTVAISALAARRCATRTRGNGNTAVRVQGVTFVRRPRRGGARRQSTAAVTLCALFSYRFFYTGYFFVLFRITYNRRSVLYTTTSHALIYFIHLEYHLRMP